MCLCSFGLFWKCQIERLGGEGKQSHGGETKSGSCTDIKTRCLDILSPTENTHKGGIFYQKINRDLDFQELQQKHLRGTLWQLPEKVEKHFNNSRWVCVLHIYYMWTVKVLQKSKTYFSSLSPVFQKCVKPSLHRHINGSGVPGKHFQYWIQGWTMTSRAIAGWLFGLAVIHALGCHCSLSSFTAERAMRSENREGVFFWW